MIVVWGALDDSPIARVLEALRARRAELAHVDAVAAAAMRYDVELGGDARSRPYRGWLELDGRRVPVEQIRGMYLRPTASPPPIPGATTTPTAATALLNLAAIGDLVAVNRPAAGRSNGAKPYQLGLIRAAGFDVPETLVTSDAAAARAFLRTHGKLIYKSISGVRSIVAVLGEAEVVRLDDLGAAGPVQLQAHIPGLDVRVHVVGDRWFACALHSDATDYRYASTRGQTAELEAYELPAGLGERLVALAKSMDLAFAGIDLRLADDGRWVCFEVNPSPGFSWYEEETGHPIADAVARLLMS